ncbi:hypothetical protein HELRODRAFT_183983 [Helobdella robusta]|uniref:SRCR domain-containing protein n=1 Tax=Helobdella robusta TaxID=6412 RepID=T1FKE1_HELRO|nr:hypothetical protein HELRODRAFT_183983 [Helobdella robusta]ESO09664.1 hypothetical protein HELRODRAFT_183983 [Helobdella robusta]
MTTLIIVVLVAVKVVESDDRWRNSSRWANDSLQQIVREHRLYKDMMNMEKMTPLKSSRVIHSPQPYEVRLQGGRTSSEGRVEILIGGMWGVICPDSWTNLEARVVCYQLGLGYSRNALKTGAFKGDKMVRLASGIECDGNEEKLSDCHHRHYGDDTECTVSSKWVAAVMCSFRLPDLVPNATMIQKSMYLQDQPMAYLQCAMEENCAAPEAFVLREKRSDWQSIKRRLLRFSAMTWNFGTAEFLPHGRKDDWEWHLCHKHYHSMSNFAEYDIIDQLGNRVAHGHKASFCLEDNYCIDGVKKFYACDGFGDQGVTIGCADIYAHDIDCQWVDISEMSVGNFTFKMKVNPEYHVGELDFDNNAVLCDLGYLGGSIKVSNCKLARG